MKSKYYQYLEQELHYFHNLDYYINQRRLELQRVDHSLKPIPRQIGKVSRRPEDLVVKFEQDSFLQWLERIRNYGSQLLSELTPDERELYDYIQNTDPDPFYDMDKYREKHRRYNSPKWFGILDKYGEINAYYKEKLK